MNNAAETLKMIMELIIKGYSDREIGEMLSIELNPEMTMELRRTAARRFMEECSKSVSRLLDRPLEMEQEKPETTRVEINSFVPGEIKTMEQMRLDALENEVRELKEQLEKLCKYCDRLSDRINFTCMR